MKIIHTAFACLMLLLAATANAQELSELTCDDFRPTPEAMARFPDLKGACDAIVERDGELYGRFSATVRRASNRSVTLYLPATDHTFRVTPDSSARVLVDGRKTRIRDLSRGQDIHIYLAVSEFAKPDIEQIILVSDAEVLLDVPVQPATLPATASNWPLVGILGGALLLMAGLLRQRRLQRVLPVVLGGAVLAGLGGAAPDALADHHGGMKPARFMTSMVRTGAIVENVDKETRELKLIDASGRRFTTRVDDEVKNFDQIQPRDRIVVDYLESLAITVVPKGSPELGQGMAVEVAGKGQKPAVRAVETVMTRAQVLKLDLSDRRATLLFEDGSVDTIKVAADTPLELVSVGDEVRFRVTHAMAVSVRKVDDM